MRNPVTCEASGLPWQSSPTRADIEKVEAALRDITDLEVDPALRGGNQDGEEELITLCLPELHRRHLVD
jgi:hypothetical protein